MPVTVSVANGVASTSNLHPARRDRRRDLHDSSVLLRHGELSRLHRRQPHPDHQRGHDHQRHLLANPSTYGQSVTFTATVSDTSSGVPTGSVEFYDGSTDLGPGSALSGSGNSATSTFTISTLTAGTHSAIKAVYTPTGNFVGSSGSLSQTVNTAALTITANSTSKTYGNTLTFAGTEFTDSGLVNGDTVSSVTLTSAGAPATATVAGSPYPIIPSAAVGSGLSNYTITYVNGTLTVTPKTLTASITAANKVYDGTTTATATNQPLSGVVNGDSVSLTGGTATFANKNVGTGKTVTDTGLSLTGTGAGNYQLASTTATTTANITPMALTITAVANTKTYDATTAAAATPTITVRLPPGLGHRQLHGDLRQQERGDQPGTHAQRDRQRRQLRQQLHLHVQHGLHRRDHPGCAHAHGRHQHQGLRRHHHRGRHSDRVGPEGERLGHQPDRNLRLPQRGHGHHPERGHIHHQRRQQRR